MTLGGALIQMKPGRLTVEENIPLDANWFSVLTVTEVCVGDCNAHTKMPGILAIDVLTLFYQSSFSDAVVQHVNTEYRVT